MIKYISPCCIFIPSNIYESMVYMFYREELMCNAARQHAILQRILLESSWQNNYPAEDRYSVGLLQQKEVNWNV